MTQPRPFFSSPNVGGHLYFTIVQRVTDNHHHPKKVTFSQNCQEVLIKKNRRKKKKLGKKLFLASNWQQFGHKLVNAIHLVDVFRLTEEYIKPLDLFEVHPSEAWWKSTLRISRDPPFWRVFEPVLQGCFWVLKKTLRTWGVSIFSWMMWYLMDWVQNISAFFLRRCFHWTMEASFKMLL